MTQPAQLIRKRDGRLADFQPARIMDAIHKAFKAVGQDDRKLAEQSARRVVGVIGIVYRNNRIPTVEEIQDLVEQTLIDDGHASVAKAYILYREQHARLRETKEILKDAVAMVDDYVDRSDWRVNENSNMDYSLQGLNNHISSILISNYWLNKIYSPAVRDAHRNADFHLHDLGLLSVYCCGWDLRQLLLEGFRGASGKVESSPAKHLRSALGQIVNFYYTMQGESAGAQAFSNFDTLLAPYVRYDHLSLEDVRQAVQGFIFNLNIPTRVGFQTPFTNLTMDLEPPASLAGEAVVWNGHLTSDTYGDFQAEMDLINRAFCEVMMHGDARGRIFTFPIPTYNVTKDFHWDDPEREILWRMTAKYGIPYFANFVNSDMNPDDVRSMCCRLRLDNRELRKRGGGLFGSNPLTGSIGVVTINLPRIGRLARTEEEFFSRLNTLMDVARESLETKRKVLEQFTESGLYPYSRHYLRSTRERFGTYWANHFSTIGLIGMHEACLNFLGKGVETPEGRYFALRALRHMRDRIQDYQGEATGALFNLEATPGEGTSYRLARADRERYPDIKASGREAPYYTNSSQLPVDFTADLFRALCHQDELQSLYTGGTVFHAFVGERIEDPQMVKQLVRKIATQFHLPYFTLTPTFTICPEHGYIPGEHHTCPYTESGSTERGEHLVAL